MIVTIFRSRLREEFAEEYRTVAEAMESRARAAPGFVSFKTFLAADGERCSIVEFDDWQHHVAWANDEQHRNAQRLGREKFYSEYSITVAEVARVAKHRAADALSFSQDESSE